MIELLTVTERDLKAAPGMRCMDCEVEFEEGDSYAHRWTAEDVAEVVCVGCAILNPSEYQLSE